MDGVCAPYSSNGETGDVKLTDGKYNFTIRGGEKITFSGIPDHTIYTVTEEDSPDYIGDTKSKTGTIYGRDVNISFTNQKVDIPDLPYTGGSGNGHIREIACILAVTAGAAFIWKKRKAR